MHFKSIGIAGAWGYIGRKFLDAALDLDWEVHVYDPGPVPEDVDPQRINVAEHGEAFYAAPVQVMHLALHPGHREKPLALLFGRAESDSEAPVILCEKPMAPPEDPALCDGIVARSEAAGARMLFDFPELFDPITHRIVDFLRGFREIAIREIWLERAKDREDPARPRNYKLMVPIQYQETVHCIAFLLNLLTQLDGSQSLPWQESLHIEGTSEPYRPPNPEDYAYQVDGRVRGRMDFGKGGHADGLTAHLQTDFKAGAGLHKRRRIAGTGDNCRFTIECDFLEGHKWLRINDIDQGISPTQSSYANVLKSLERWHTEGSLADCTTLQMPGARFARYTYLLSAALWEACFTKAPVRFPAPADLGVYQPAFPREWAELKRRWPFRPAIA
jgi:predicted dehydrogenase